MGSAPAAVLDVMMAAATSLDIFAFGFLVFFGRALISAVPFDAGPVASVLVSRRSWDPTLVR